MADLNAAKRRIAAAPVSVDIDSMRSAIHARLGGRPLRIVGGTSRIQQHADAVGRGEPSVSPAKARSNRG